MQDRKQGLRLLGVDVDNIRNSATTCPECSHTRKKNKERCLSVNVQSGHVHCNHCGWKARADSDEWINKEIQSPMEPKFKKSDFITTPLTATGVDYLKSRGISETTIREMRIAGDGNAIIFNYYRGDQIHQAKYRSITDKKFWCRSNAKCLYNINSLNGQTEAIIVEGEIDALSFHEAGFKNVVSVDFGASNEKDMTTSGKLACLDKCYDSLRKIKKFYIATDADPPGKKLQEELCRRLGKEKCLIVQFPKGCKDANEVLVNHGPKALQKSIQKAKRVPITGVVRLADVYKEMQDQLQNGLAKGQPTGVASLNGHFSWLPGELTLFTGLPNSGKSEFVKFLLSKMVKNKGWKFGVFSPENYPASSFYLDWIHTYTGRNTDKEYDNPISEEELKKAAKIINDHIFYIYPEGNEKHTPANIRQKIKELTLQHGLNGYVVDPWNMLLHEGLGSREDLYISEQLTKFSRINHEHDLCGIIVVHPKGIPYKEEPNAYHHIAGGPMFINKCDNAVVIHRPNYQEDKSDRQVDFKIEKIRRQKLVGRPTTVNFQYDLKSARYISSHSNQFPLK